MHIHLHYSCLVTPVLIGYAWINFKGVTCHFRLSFFFSCT